MSEKKNNLKNNLENFTEDYSCSAPTLLLSQMI